MNKHVTIQIKGRVQGVWFRRFVKNKAKEIGLVGYARNNIDGTVTIEACGDKDKLMELIKWCETGSKMARVLDVEYIFDDVCSDCSNFEVL